MNCECCSRPTFALGSLGPYCFECALITILEHRDRRRRNMSDEIKVGGRVQTTTYGEEGTVLAVYKDWAWIDFGGPSPCMLVRKFLTLISPDPVTLTPKYRVGQNMRFQGGIYPIEKVVVAYELTGWFGLRGEDNLEPVPEPCPECGK